MLTTALTTVLAIPSPIRTARRTESGISSSSMPRLSTLVGAEVMAAPLVADTGVLFVRHTTAHRPACVGETPMHVDALISA